MDDKIASPLVGDRPLQSGQPDRLGYRDVAERIALSLIDHASDGGLVIGLEGAWGSGKSSLLYLIEDALKQVPEQQQPTVIDFRPWLVGSRDALLTNLFSAISKGIASIKLSDGNATETTIIKVKETAEALRKFVAGIGKVGDMVEAAGDVADYKLAKFFGALLKGGREATKDRPEDVSLDILKDKLVSSLRELGHRFVITIDDVDRLEPSEVIEVLRLVRSVADFPNVIYLLCYDSAILSHSIQKAAQVRDGQAYLEKIVQLTVMVPKPEPFQLRQWFTDELKLIAKTKTDDELARLRLVVDYEGSRQLRTPRAVVRILDSIRFFWPPLRAAGADLADLVWLSLIKDGNPGLYRWIEDYCGTAAVLSLRTGQVGDNERIEENKKLSKLVSESYFSDLTYRHYFADQLAGCELDYGKDASNFKLHQKVPDHVRDKSIKDCRLSSPDHYRLYFALAGPAHALTQHDLDQLWSASDLSEQNLGELILSWHLQLTPNLLSKADILLERMKEIDPDVLTASRSKCFLVAFSNVLDEAYRRRSFDLFWFNSVWDRAERIVPILLSRISDAERSAVIDVMFRDGLAISWLSTLFRSETFAHGRFGDRRKQNSEWVFSDVELDMVSKTLLARYKHLSLDQILGTVSPVTILYAWKQGGDENGPQSIIESSIASEKDLIETLDSLRSLMRWRDISSFLDVDEVWPRVIATIEESQDVALSERAKLIKSDFELQSEM